jgi:UDP-N-acetylmuramoylalanine--D-glutamate ligase
MKTRIHTAVITNIEPNHLDWHKDMNEYINAKKNIVLHQNAFGKAILNFDDQQTSQFKCLTRGEARGFSLTKKFENSIFVEQNKIYFLKNGKQTPVISTNQICLPGRHNLQNYLAAIAAVWGFVPVEAIAKVAKEFLGVEHRIEFVRELEGVKYYNDSIATSPTRTINGMLSLFSQKIILIAGGYDKNISFETLANKVIDKVKILILMGKTAKKIEKSVKDSKKYKKNSTKIFFANNLQEATELAKSLSQNGDIVALSPACASFDFYQNFAKRGEHFKNLINNF